MRTVLWHNRLLVALLVNAGLMVCVLLAIGDRAVISGGVAFAQAASPHFASPAGAAPKPASVTAPATPATSVSATPVGQPQPLIVMPGQLAPNIFGCYLLDPAHQSLCVYEYFHSDGLKLVASRNIAYDSRLQNFNTSPAPSEVKNLSQSSTDATPAP